MKAALDLIAENGFHASPTSLIAQNAGVGTGTIYRYFKNKDALIEAIHEETHEELLIVMFDGDAEDLPVRDRFIRIFTNLIKYLLRYPSTLKFLEQYYNSPYGIDKKREKLSSGDDPLGKLMDYAKAQHIVKNLDNQVLHAISFGPFVFLLKDHIAGFIQIDDELIGKIVEACWDGLKR